VSFHGRFVTYLKCGAFALTSWPLKSKLLSRRPDRFKGKKEMSSRKVPKPLCRKQSEPIAAGSRKLHISFFLFCRPNIPCVRCGRKPAEKGVTSWIPRMV
jgi:hypothetical protein